MATGEAPSSTRVGLPSRMVSSSFPELTPGTGTNHVAAVEMYP
jgi:hypothetical protein